MLKYWLAEQIMASNFQVARYTLALYWVVRYGSNQADLDELEELRLRWTQEKS